MSLDFIQFCKEHGLIINGIRDDGQWQRVPTVDKPRHRNGAYRFLGDVGFVQNHATMSDVAVWHPNKTFSEEEKRLYARNRQIQMKEKRAKQIRDMQCMANEFNAFKSLRGHHPYLMNKNLSMLGCTELRVTPSGELVIPILSKGGYLLSYQTIDATGNKKFKYGCSVKGGFYRLHRQNSTVICLAEGFATGLAIFQNIRDADVIVCFNAGNMETVAKDLNIKSKLVVVCADNDWLTAATGPTKRNEGVIRGQEAAKHIGCGLAYPEGITGSDWADALNEWNLQAGRYNKNAGGSKMRAQIMREARLVK